MKETGTINVICAVKPFPMVILRKCVSESVPERAAVKSGDAC